MSDEDNLHCPFGGNGETSNLVRNDMKSWIPASAVLLTLASVPAFASEATFEKTLSVSGAVTLHVSTGSGNIHITPGSDSQVHILAG